MADDKRMTVAEAEKYITRAQDLPASRIDTAKLAEAMEVIEEENPPLVKVDWHQFFDDAWRWPATQIEGVLKGFGSFLLTGAEMTGEVVEGTQSTLGILGDLAATPTEGPQYRRGPDPSKYQNEILIAGRDLAARVAAEQQANGGPIATTTPVSIAAVERQALQSQAAEQGITVAEAIAQNQSVTDQLTAIDTETGTDEEVPFSNYLFPSGFAGIEPARHLQQVASDDYSPYGNVTRTNMANQMTTMIRQDRRLSGGKEWQEGTEYWRNQYITPGGYEAGMEVYTWASMSTRTRARLEEKMVSAGLLDPDGGYVPGAMGIPQLAAMRQGMMVGNLLGVGFEVGLNRLSADFQAFQRAEARRNSRGRTGSGFSRPKFSVPAHLREIPDYESLAQDTTNRFRDVMKRDPQDWEMTVLADQLKSMHQLKNQKSIEAARAAFYAAQGGEQGVMEVEVPNPDLRNQRFIEERYGAEIDRQENIENTAITNRLMIDAITKGGMMVGGEV